MLEVKTEDMEFEANAFLGRTELAPFKSLSPQDHLMSTPLVEVVRGAIKSKLGSLPGARFSTENRVLFILDNDWFEFWHQGPKTPVPQDSCYFIFSDKIVRRLNLNTFYLVTNPDGTYKIEPIKDDLTQPYQENYEVPAQELKQILSDLALPWAFRTEQLGELISNVLTPQTESERSNPH